LKTTLFDAATNCNFLPKLLNNLSVPVSGFKNPKIKPVTPNALYIGKSVLAGKCLSGWCLSVGLLAVMVLVRAARGRRPVIERIQTSEIVRQ